LAALSLAQEITGSGSTLKIIETLLSNGGPRSPRDTSTDEASRQRLQDTAPPLGSGLSPAILIGDTLT